MCTELGTIMATAQCSAGSIDAVQLLVDWSMSLLLLATYIGRNDLLPVLKRSLALRSRYHVECDARV